MNEELPDILIINNIDDFMRYKELIDNNVYHPMICEYMTPQYKMREIELKNLWYKDDEMMTELLKRNKELYPNDPDYQTDDIYYAFVEYEGRDLYTNDWNRRAFFKHWGKITLGKRIDLK